MEFSLIRGICLFDQSYHMQFVMGDISNRQSQLQDATLPSVLVTNHSAFLLSDHAHLSHRW
jgi:hypothetical protein